MDKIQNKNWLVFGIVIVGIFIFVKTLNFDFVNIDDPVMIFENPAITNPNWNWSNLLSNQFPSPNYKPLTNIFWKIEYGIFGNNPMVFHLNNLILHLLNSILVFVFIGRVSTFWAPLKNNNIEIAFFCSLIFLIHPMKAESVAWVVERKDVLYGFFFLIGALSYLRYLLKDGNKWIWLIISMICLMLSVASKSTGITLFLLFILLDFHHHKNIRMWWKASFLLCFLFGILGIGFITQSEGVFSEYLIGYTSSSEYLSLPSILQIPIIFLFRMFAFVLHFFIPIYLAIVYPFDQIIGTLGYGVYAIIILGIISLYYFFKRRKETGPLNFGLFFFFITVIPALIMPVSGTNFLSDRYLYIPSIGLMFAFIGCWYYMKPSKIKWRSLFLLGLTVVLGCYTFFRLDVWKNSESLFTDLIYKFPSEEIGYTNLGYYYEKQGKDEKAMPLYNQALQINPNFHEALLNRSGIYLKRQETDLAMLDANLLIQNYSNYSKAYTNRGAIWASIGETEAAISDLNQAIKLAKYSPEAYLNKAKIYASQKDFQQALDNFNNYLNFNPFNAEVIYLKGVCQWRIGSLEEAENNIQKAISLNSKDGRFYLTLSELYYQNNKIDLARKFARSAKENNAPISTEYWNLLFGN